MGGVEWIKLAQDSDQWWALVNAVMNLCVLMPRSWLYYRNMVRDFLFRRLKIGSNSNLL
jgi:hypothetical protein